MLKTLLLRFRRSHQRLPVKEGGYGELHRHQNSLYPSEPPDVCQVESRGFVRDDDEACSAGPLGGGTKARQQHDISRALTYWQEYKRRKKEAGNGIDT